MASWSVTSISATPDFACVNDESPPAITLPRKQIIWDQLNINDYIDDSYEGSKRPVVFRTTQAYIFGAPPQVPTEVTGTVKVPTAIEVTGTANFPESWEGATYTVSALLGDVKVLESERIRVVPGSSEVSAKNFSLLLSNPAAAAEIPFRLSGDFSWLIELVDNPDSSETGCPAENPTRLELCWARSAAPNGNPTPTKPDVTRVNLGGIYPIVLLRLFSPNPTEFLGEPPDSILGWYINRAMKAIWDWPNSDDDISPQYDVTEGKSGFDMLYSGGIFPLRKWVKKQYYKVNCYDLAAVSQLACAILVDEEGNELLGSRWVCQIPNGFINPGPLFGWNKVEDGKNHMMCNNPLWRNGSYCSMPDAPQQCLGRSSFSMHVWVEINGAQVLDACHASTENPHPDTGTRSREVYLMETIDQNRDPRTRGNAENYMENGNAEGSCRINPYAQTARLGVIGISGYDPGVKGSTGSSNLTSKQGYLGMSDSPMLKKARSPLTKPPAKARPPPTNTRSPFSRPMAPIDVSTDHPVMDLPEDFRRYIEDTLERGRSSKPPVKTINRARVDPETLISLLAPETTPQKPQTSLSIRPDVTEIQITFDCTRENLKAIHLALDVFNSYETAIDGLTRHLLTFSNFESLGLIVKPLDQTIGHFCYKTSDSIFWIHGNLLIRIHESKNDPFAPAGDPAIFEMATKLDNHLDSTAHHPTSPPEFDLPRPIDRSGSPPKFIAPIDSPIDNPHEPPPNSGVPDNKVQVLHVRSGETFTAQVAGKASFLPTREASCRDTNIILPVGPTKEGDFEFYAVEPGKTEVCICVADAETLSPTELIYEIFVDHNSD